MKKKNIPDIILEKYVLNELTDDEMQQLRIQIGKDAILKRKIQNIKKSNKEILNQYDSRKMAQKIHAKLRNQETGPEIIPEMHNPFATKWKLSLGIFSAVGTFGLALFVFNAMIRQDVPQSQIVASRTEILSSDNNTSPHNEIIYLKGENEKLFIYRKNNNQAELLANDSPADARDLIQIGYFVAKPCYGAIFSIDSRGVITMHMPTDPSDTERFSEGKKILLNNSYELDDAPLYEIFFLVTSDKKFAANDAALAIKNKITSSENILKTRNFELDNSIRVASVLLKKGGVRE